MASPHSSTWAPRRLGDLVKLTSGKSPSGFKFAASGKPYFKVDQLGKSTKYLDHTSTPYLSDAIPNVPAGSVLIAKRGAAIALNRVRLLAEPGFMDTNVMALTPTSAIESEFLYYWLSHRGLWDIADVTSVPQINNKHIIPLPIALPRLDEQRAVSATLREVDELISALERLIIKKREMKQGVTQTLLAGRIRLPGFASEWSRFQLGDLGVFYKGRGIRRDDVKMNGVPCVRYGELYTTYHDYTETLRSFVSPSVAKLALPLQPGDVLFPASGETREDIGVSVAYVGRKPAVAGGDIIVLRGTGFDPIYLALLTNTPGVAQQKARLGQGDAVVHINSRALGCLEVNLPPLDEQEAIAAVVRVCDDGISGLRRQLAKASAIKQGMIQGLFSGRTRLPIAEPAV